ncbi:MAG: tetratricopeptide repeat protein, partial [Desulfobaccales bacterium]
MMARRPSVQRLLAAALVLAMPLCLCQCAKKTPPPAVRGLTPEETSKLESFHNPWPTQKPTEPESLPKDHLESLGDLALQNRNFENSLVNYLQILKDHPERTDLRYKVGVIFLMSGKLDAAQKELAAVLVQQPKMLQAHEALGLVLLQKKEYPLAVDEFQYVLAQDTNRPKTHHLLGVTFLESGRPERAIFELKAASALNPRQVSTLLALSQAYMKIKDYRQATATLKQAQTLAPQNKNVNNSLGMALAAQKQYPQALEAFMKSGDEAQAYNNIGVHYFMDGHYEDAAKCFQRAMELRPTFYQEAKT